MCDAVKIFYLHSCPFLHLISRSTACFLNFALAWIMHESNAVLATLACVIILASRKIQRLGGGAYCITICCFLIYIWHCYSFDSLTVEVTSAWWPHAKFISSDFQNSIRGVGNYQVEKTDFLVSWKFLQLLQNGSAVANFELSPPQSPNRNPFFRQKSSSGGGVPT